MKTNNIIHTITLACALSASICARAAPQPNFLFIAIDDLNTAVGYLSEEPGNLLQTLFPDPEKRAEIAGKLTPNLDRLAARSRIFTRSYCQSPLYGPSRTALLTGIPTHQSGYYGHRINFRDHAGLESVTTLPQLLREHGYYTAGIGKIFHKPRFEMVDGRRIDWTDRDRSWDAFAQRNHGVQRHPDDVPPRYSLPWDTYIHYGRTHTRKEDTNDYQNVSVIADLLMDGKASIKGLDGRVERYRLPDDKPFFLAAGIFQPHLPWKTPHEFFDRIPIGELHIDRELMDFWQSDLDDVPQAGREWTFLGSTKGNEFGRFLSRAVEMDGEGADLQTLREMVQAYLACVAFADFCVGRLLDALDNSPHADNTVVILWSDHGYHLGEKARMGKTALWEEADHCILLISDPLLDADDGRKTAAPVSLQDLYPTVISRAGLDLPGHVAGRDLTPILKDPQSWPDGTVLCTWLEGNHAVRDDRYCYIRYRDGSEELYDDREDPDQHRNLAGNAQYQAVIDRLAAALPR